MTYNHAPLRVRDTAAQERVHVDELVGYLRGRIGEE
jgi:hypothetical protein